MKINKVERVYRAIKIDARVASRGLKAYFAEKEYDDETIEISIGKVVSKNHHIPTAVDQVIAELEEIIKDLHVFKEKSAELKKTFHMYE